MTRTPTSWPRAPPAVAERLGLDRDPGWGLAWQSAGATPEPWRGPDVNEVIPQLAADPAVDGVLVCAQGFTSDHLEIVYDLDLESARVAADAGIAFARTRSLNDDPTVLAALADRVAEVGRMTRRDERPIVVVGGGITGLTAAYRLALGGASVALVEPDQLGGKLRTSVFAGRPVDEGADAFLLRVPWALAAVRRPPDRRTSSSPRPSEPPTSPVAGGLHPLPEGHVLGVPTDLDALAASGVVSEAGVRRAAEDLDLPAADTDPAVSGDDVAIAPYLRRRLGDEVFEQLVDPLVGGINAGDTERLSLAAVVPQLDAAARSGDPSLIRSCRAQRERAAMAPGAGPAAPVFASPLGGMARIVDAIVGFLPDLDLRLGRRVVGLEPAAGDGATVTLDDGTTIEAAGVVLASPTGITAGLVGDLAPDTAAVLAAIEYTSVTLVTFAFDRADIADPLAASGLLVPHRQGRIMTACSFATSKWAQLRDPERDDVVLRVSAGRHGDERHLDLDDRAVVDALLDDLDATIGVRGAPGEVRVNRWTASFPQYAPGHLDRIDAAEAALAGGCPERRARRRRVPRAWASPPASARATRRPTASWRRHRPSSRADDRRPARDPSTVTEPRQRHHRRAPATRPSPPSMPAGRGPAAAGGPAGRASAG